MSNLASRTKLIELESRIAAATGQDRNLDTLVSTTLAAHEKTDGIPDYTSSVDACLALIAEILPDWHWHIGHGPDGILPYAALRNQNDLDDDTQLSFTASAPTVPLALLHATVKAAIANRRR